MKVMKNNKTGECINVVEHIITSNLWEFYVTDEVSSEDVVKCLVMGFETELGAVSLSEIAPYVISRCKKLNVAAAPNWEWI